MLYQIHRITEACSAMKYWGERREILFRITPVLCFPYFNERVLFEINHYSERRTCNSKLRHGLGQHYGEILSVEKNYIFHT